MVALIYDQRKFAYRRALTQTNRVTNDSADVAHTAGAHNRTQLY